MTNGNLGFTTSYDDAKQREFGELPDGDYEFWVDKADLVDTKAGNGKLVKTEFTVMAPEAYAGRKLWANYNVANRSAQAEEIGRRELNCLARAIGIQGLQHTEELPGRTFHARVGLGKPSNGYPARAEIKRYWFPDEGNVPEPSVVETEQQQAVTRVHAPANQNVAPAAVKAKPAATGKHPWGTPRR